MSGGLKNKMDNRNAKNEDDIFPKVVALILILMCLIAFIIIFITSPKQEKEICLEKKIVCFNLDCRGAMPHICRREYISCDEEHKFEDTQCVKYGIANNTQNSVRNDSVDFEELEKE